MGITYRQLDHWTRQGWLRAENATPGSGHARVWPPEELMVAGLMRRLTLAGFSASRAAAMARDAVETADLVDGSFTFLLAGGLVLSGHLERVSS